MKVAVVGGTFDPFHLGHRAVCEAVSELSDIGQVLLVPAARSPFKPGEPTTPGALRLAMAVAGVVDLPKCAVSDLELERPAPSYTIETLRELSRRRPGDAFALVLGADQAAAFREWKDCDSILAEYEILLSTRAGHPAPQGLRARLVQVKDVPISATRIRRLLAAGQGVADWVPAAVLEIIERERLYTRRPQS